MYYGQEQKDYLKVRSPQKLCSPLQLDFGASGLLALLWLAGSWAWADGLTGTSPSRTASQCIRPVQG
jgi:hypothetical protein